LETPYHAQSAAKPPKRSIFLKTALNFADRGIPVFPLKGKRPLTPHGYKDASAHPPKVTALFNAAPNATGIGIPTGSFSGLVVGDKDSDSEEARRIWDSLPPTLEVATGRASGLGRHRYYRVPKGTKVKSRDLAEGLELKADGCYVVAAGSVHPSGNRYEFCKRLEIAELPAHLLEPEPSANSSVRRGPTVSPPFEDDGGPIHEGVRNRTVFFMALALKDNGVGREQALQILLTQNEARCVPALDPGEVGTIVKSAFRYPVRGRRTPPEVTEALGHLKRRWWQEAWRGVGGKTERDVVRVLIQFAERYGHLIELGVRVTISHRDLALASGCSRKTIQRVVKRLRLSGWLRGDNGHRKGTDAGAFILLARQGDSTPSIRGASLCMSGDTLSRLPEITPCFRWRGFVGKGKAGVLYALEVFGEQTLDELATRLGFSRARDLRRLYLEPLIEMGLIESRGGTYALPGADAYEERIEDIRTSRYGGGPRKERKKDANGRWVARVVEVPPKSEVERLEVERVKYEAERERFRRALEVAA
jgi:Bifunctional DNA primase/polymerase, N-terminal/Primase C terminal 1 (PriCT-1)